MVVEKAMRIVILHTLLKSSGHRKYTPDNTSQLKYTREGSLQNLISEGRVLVLFHEIENVSEWWNLSPNKATLSAHLVLQNYIEAVNELRKENSVLTLAKLL